VNYNNTILGPSSGKCERCGGWISVNPPMPCKWCELKEHTEAKKEEEHHLLSSSDIMKLLDLIRTSIISEGGDGDAVWLSKHRTLDEIEELINRYNKYNQTSWEVVRKENRIMWGEDLEWCIITDNEELFNSMPKYVTFKLIY
jgi:hypothetical protein